MPEKTTNKKGNIYDRLFKQNAHAIFIPLIRQELGFQIESYKPLQTKISKTLERELDFLYIIKTEEQDELLLHIEFQSVNDSKMIDRMQEYHGFIYRKHQLPIRHIVIYLGNENTAMNTQLPENARFTSFDLINIHKIDPDELLSSQVPEVVLLALLSNFKKDRLEAVLRLIVKKLRTITKLDILSSYYTNQLIILSRLRKLENETTKILDRMPVTIDIEKDGLYLQGVQKGIEQERIRLAKELEEAELEKVNAIKALLEMNIMEVHQIASIMSVTEEYVLDIKRHPKT